MAAEWVKRGGCLLDAPGLARQATAPTYWFDHGKLRVEEKAQIKVRLGMSPDDWDAPLCTFAYPDIPTGSIRWSAPGLLLDAGVVGRSSASGIRSPRPTGTCADNHADRCPSHPAIEKPPTGCGRPVYPEPISFGSIHSLAHGFFPWKRPRSAGGHGSITYNS